MEATKVKSRQRKLDWKELEKDVKQKSQSKLSDKAKKNGVNQAAIFYALKRMNFPWKKKQLRYREINREERIKYYQLSLEIWSKKMEVKALYLFMNHDFKVIKTVFMPGQKKGKKFMVSTRKNEVKEKI